MNILSWQVLASYWNMAEMASNAVIFLNLLGSLALGLMVGYERSYRGRAAGMRTYGLVCMASCAIMVITGYTNHWYGGTLPAQVSAIDPARVIQGVCTGIGFLGAGVIMRDGLNISGLTTAASIWAVSAVGVLVGVGFYVAAIGLALMSTFLMMWGAKIDAFLPSHHAIAVVLHFHKNYVPSENDLQQLVLQHGYSVAKGSFAVSRRDNQYEWRCVVVSVEGHMSRSLTNLGRAMSNAEGVDSFNLTHARN